MNDVKAIDNERVPYQLPMPKEALSEIVVPDALAKEDDRLWVQQTKNVFFRPPLSEYLPRLLDESLESDQIRSPLTSSASKPGSRFCSERKMALSGT